MPVAFTDHATRRPVDLRAECDARGADYPERETAPGSPRPARPARPVVRRWRPTLYSSVDGFAWALLSAPRAWTFAAGPRVAPASRRAAHARAVRAWAEDRALRAAYVAAIAWAAVVLAYVSVAL